MRRNDRAVIVFADQLSILENCEIARIGFSTGGAPYIVPMHFAYEAVNGTLRLYFHCAGEGRKLTLLSQNPRVCFEADRLLATVPSGEACAWTARYESVMGEGLLETVTDKVEKTAAMDLLMARYGYGKTPVYNESAFAAVTMLRLTVTQMTGKKS